jgi:hypothetical protein
LTAAELIKSDIASINMIINQEKDQVLQSTNNLNRLNNEDANIRLDEDFQVVNKAKVAERALKQAAMDEALDAKQNFEDQIKTLRELKGLT